MSVRARAGALAALLALALPIAVPGPAAARDSLGVFGDWGAYRDAAVPRCHAIAEPVDSAGRPRPGASAALGWWPRRAIRGQLHLRLRRPADPRRPVVLELGNRRFAMLARGRDAWARDRRADAAIIAAMRAERTMRLTATGADGRAMAERWRLAGAATAIDAAAIGCARSG